MSKVSCPICDKPMDGQGPKEWPDWPFCGKRCRLVDLGRWLSGTYRIETAAGAGDLDDAADSPPKSAAPSAVPDRDEA
jgi:uncharacterized protein